MNKWTHPQGLAALVAGVYAALSPIWTTHPDGKAMATMITLGVITALLALVSLASPGRIAFEGLVALMGVLFIISPWVMSFTPGGGFTAFAWTAWIVGVVALVAGAADVQVTRTEQHRGLVTH
jgi:hypothetical protein